MTDKHGGHVVGKRRASKLPKRPTCQVRQCDQPIKDNAYVCPTCAAQLSADLGNVAALADDLAITYTRRSRMADSNGASKSAESAVPFDDRARREADALSRVLAKWAGAVLEKRRIDDVGPTCWQCHHATCKLLRAARPPADNTLSWARWLMHNVQWIRHSPTGPVMVEDIARACKRVLFTVDRRADLWYAGTCLTEYDDTEGQHQVCTQELYAKPDALEILCRACRTKHDVETRRKWLLEYAEDHLADAGLISRALTRLNAPVTSERIRQWKHRGHIEALDTDSHGRDLFRVGDVIDLIQQHNEAEARRLAKPNKPATRRGAA